MTPVAPVGLAEPTPAPEPTPTPSPAPVAPAHGESQSEPAATGNNTGAQTTSHGADTPNAPEVGGGKLDHVVSDGLSPQTLSGESGLSAHTQILGADHIDGIAAPSHMGASAQGAFVVLDGAVAHASAASDAGSVGIGLDHLSHDVINPEALFAQAGLLNAPVPLEAIDTQWGGSADHGAGWTSSTLEVDLTSAPSDPSTQGGWTVYVDHQPYVPTAHEQQLGAIHLDGPAHVSIVLFDASGAPQSLSADHVDTITWGAGGHIG